MSTPNKKSGDPAAPADLGQDPPAGGKADGSSEPYETGYKKPPKHSQFQKGNKVGKGRPKGSKNLKTIVNEVMVGEKVAVLVGGKTTKYSRLELSVRQIGKLASKGDIKAYDRAIALYERYGPQEDPDGPEPEKLKRDYATLQAFLAMKHLIGPSEDDAETGNV